ncbi:MAG TPA: histidine kinase [Gallionella sp.]|nr:histidine kinase [Gallionella sp.]
MNNARSIKQNARPDTLPNFRNLGIMLRILVISNGLAILQAVMLANEWSDVAQRMLEIETLLTPVLLTSMLLLWIAQPWLNRLPYWQGALATVVIVAALTLSFYEFGRDLFNPAISSKYLFDEVRYTLLSAAVSVILLLYFRLRAKMLTRALHEARLQVLRARIRPHFLFNTINAVLGIVRTRPKQAETALEDMADLFRIAMSDARDLVPLSREIQLSKQYLALEQMRMGDRLNADWQVNEVPENALIPPLLLQPLLENAVYHGIETLPQGGSIRIILTRKGDELYLTVENPCVEHGPAATGRHRIVELQKKFDADSENARYAGSRQRSNNRMALLNIRERLDLLFDAEASYQVEHGDRFYRVEIVLPYIKERPS